MVPMFKITLLRFAIGAPAVAGIGAGAYFAPDQTRSAYRTAQDAAESFAAPFEGHVGLLAEVLADGWPIVIATAIFLVGIIIAMLVRGDDGWRALGFMLIVPFIAKLVSVGLAYLHMNDWLIEAGRNINDALPRAVRSWGNLVGLEQQLQIVILMAVLTLLFSLLSLRRRAK